MKYKVEYLIDNKDQAEGYEPHSDIYADLDDIVKAESEDEAIGLAIDYLVEGIIQGSEYDPEVVGKEIRLYEDGELYEVYYGFCTEVIEE